MALNFIEKGDSLDIVLGASAPSGGVVVLGDLVGVYSSGGVAGNNVSVQFTGVYALPKATIGGSGIAVGTKVYWDTVGLVITSTAGALKIAGYVWATAADADATVAVRLLG